MSFKDVERQIQLLNSHKKDWSGLSRSARLDLLKDASERLLSLSEEWVRLSCSAKGIDFTSSLAGEEWISGPAAVMRFLRLLIAQIKKNHETVNLPQQKIGEQNRLQVFPQSVWEKLFLPGVQAELWVSEGKEVLAIDPGKSHFDDQGIALVLGAGNVSSIAPLDVLHKLFVEGQVVILKMNPVNAYLGPLIEKIFEAFIEKGFLQLSYGGAELGQFLCHHDLVKSIHMTGSVDTHDLIVWGDSKAEQVERKKNNDPKLKKQITSELGCVTPILVIPGKWSEKELEYQARSVASMLANNAGFNCAAAKVIITHRQWPLREKFLEKLKQKLAQMPSRKAYYPGAMERFEKFKAAYPKSSELSEKAPDCIPWTLVTDVDNSSKELAFAEEMFCGVLAETAISCESVEQYFELAASFANEKLFGTLSCVVLIDKPSEKNYKLQFEKLLVNLKYGGIGINIWSASLYWLMSTTWGAYPGHPLSDVQSGRGWVHNTFMIRSPEKSILKAPFTMFPTPTWFSDNKNLAAIGKRLLSFEQRPGLIRFLRLAVAGLKG